MNSERAPRFSVVIAAKDYGRFLGQAIESVLQQTLDDELIVVDDGSTDDTREVSERFGNRLRYIYHENRGQGGALNTGFHAARGELIALLDADDTFYPGKLAELHACFEGDPEIGMVQHRLDILNEQGELMHTTPFRRKLDEGFLRDALIRYGGTWHSITTTATSALAFRRATLERILPIPEADFRTMADGYLVTQAALVAPVGAIHRSLGAYRMHGRNNWTPTTLTSEWLRTRLLAPLERVSELVGERVMEEAREKHAVGSRIPLTPALSRGERENCTQSVRQENPRSLDTRGPIAQGPSQRERCNGGRTFLSAAIGHYREGGGQECPPSIRVCVTDDRQFMEYRCLAEKMEGNWRLALRSYGLLVKALWRDHRVSMAEKTWRMLSVFSMLVLPAGSYTRLRQWYADNDFLYAWRKKIFAPKPVSFTQRGCRSEEAMLPAGEKIMSGKMIP